MLVIGCFKRGIFKIIGPFLLSDKLHPNCPLELLPNVITFPLLSSNTRLKYKIYSKSLLVS